MPNIPDSKKSTTKMAVTWDSQEGFNRASAQLNTALEKSQPVYQRSSAAIANRYQNIDSFTSVRDGFSSVDYQFLSLIHI